MIITGLIAQSFFFRFALLKRWQNKEEQLAQTHKACQVILIYVKASQVILIYVKASQVVLIYLKASQVILIYLKASQVILI